MTMQYNDFFITIEENLDILSIYNNETKKSKLLLKPELETKIREFDGKDSKNPEEIDDAWVRELGDKLFDALFSGEIKDQFIMAMDEIEDSDNSGLRILLKTKIVRFADFPWEAIRHNGIFMATEIKTPFVRLCVPGKIKQKTRPVTILEQTPKIFPMLSNVSNQSGVQTQIEREILEECTETKIEDFPAKISRIKEELRNNRNVGQSPFNIVHFLGHGSYSEEKGSSLVLCSEDNSKEKSCEADGNLLKEIFHNVKSIGLFVLNGCDTAKVSSSFSGLVPDLLEMVPAVIAMRKPIHKDSAKMFSKCFYKNLVATDIEETMQYARSDMKDATGFKMDFCIPVLYLGYSEIGGATKQVFNRNKMGTVDKPLTRPKEFEQTDAEKAFDNFIKLHDYFYTQFSSFLTQLSVDITTNQINFLKNMPSMYMQPLTQFQTHIDDLKLRVRDTFPDEFPEWNNEIDSIDINFKGILNSIAQTSPEKLKEHSISFKETYPRLEKVFSRIITGSICQGDKS